VILCQNVEQYDVHDVCQSRHSLESLAYIHLLACSLVKMNRWFTDINSHENISIRNKEWVNEEEEKRAHGNTAQGLPYSRVHYLPHSRCCKTVPALGGIKSAQMYLQGNCYS